MELPNTDSKTAILIPGINRALVEQLDLIARENGRTRASEIRRVLGIYAERAERELGITGEQAAG